LSRKAKLKEITSIALGGGEIREKRLKKKTSLRSKGEGSFKRLHDQRKASGAGRRGKEDMLEGVSKRGLGQRNRKTPT